MEYLSNLAPGFASAFAPINLLCAVLGCLLGGLLGVLPGMAPLAAAALLLPVAHGLPPTSAPILLAAVYLGGHYSATWDMASVRAFVRTCAMALAGMLLLAALAPSLSKWGLSLGATERLALLLLALVGMVVLASGHLVKGLAMVVQGVLLGLVGTDVPTGLARFTLDVPALADGVGFVALAMGLLIYGDLFKHLARGRPAPQRVVSMRVFLPAVALLSTLGIYSLHHSLFDIWLMAGFGVVGYVFHWLELEAAPLLLGYMLGPLMEENLQGALQLSGGDWSVFVTHPLSAGLLLASVCLLVLLPVVQGQRDKV